MANSESSKRPVPSSALRSELNSPILEPAPKEARFASVPAGMVDVPPTPGDADVLEAISAAEAKGFTTVDKSAAVPPPGRASCGAPHAGPSAAPPAAAPCQHQWVQAGVMSREDFKALLDKAKQEITQSSCSSMDDLLTNYDRYINKRIGSVEAEVHVIQQENATCDAHILRHDHELAQLRAILEANKADDKAKDFFTQGAWDRTPNGYELAINCDSLVSKSAITKTMADFYGDNFDQGDWQSGGSFQPLSRRWKMVFLGGAVSGQRRAEKAFGLLKREGGGWHEIWCRAPDGNFVRVYVSKDKNHKQIASEVLVKKCLEICRERYSSLNWGFSRADSAVTLDWKPCLQLQPNVDKTFVLRQDAAVANQYKIDVPAVRAALEQLYGRKADATQWSL